MLCIFVFYVTFHLTLVAIYVGSKISVMSLMVSSLLLVGLYFIHNFSINSLKF